MGVGKRFVHVVGLNGDNTVKFDAFQWACRMGILRGTGTTGDIILQKSYLRGIRCFDVGGNTKAMVRIDGDTVIGSKEIER